MAQSPSEFKPLAPFISSCTHFSNQEDQPHISERQTIRMRKFIRCCGCVTAIIVIFVVILIVLAFTVYNVKEPEVKMNGVTLLNATLASLLFNRTLTNDNNITLLADISVKNPNAFTFRFGNTTTTVYYDGKGIGQGTTAPGKAKARRTMRFNVTMEIMAKELLDNPNLVNDLKDQAFNISSYTRIDGKVKILNLIKRKVVVDLNCTNQYNYTTGLITHGENCVGFVDI
ncbi:Late embryogenesis abundant protein [Sesbania bispinosa]|nr:Late embryogenesis abundant protein [Sesbania bispinosa]